MATSDGQVRDPERRPVPEVVAPTNRVNVALPFSSLRVEESSKDLAELAAVVADLTEIVEGLAPGPKMRRLRERARVLTNRLH